MSDSSAFAFGKFIPGFDFLQHLAGQPAAAPGAAPGLGGWVAPTVNPQELDKRIQELKAVLFWLEQNAAAVKATIQALEVQKMTLATLASMNLSMAEVARAFTVATPAASPATAPTARARTPPAPDASPALQWPFGASPAETAAPTAAPDAPDAPAETAPEPAPTPEAAAPGMADPLQWWGALTQQFQHIAANALQEAARAQPPAPAPAAKTGKAAKSAAPAAATRKKPAAKASAKKAQAPATRKPAARKPAAKPPAADWPLPPPVKPT